MYKPVYFFIGLRYLCNSHSPKFKKIINLLSIISVSISTTALIIIISIINGSEENFKKNILYFTPHLIITNKNKYINKSEFPEKILQINNIEKVSDFINKEVIIQSDNDVTIAEIIGIDSTNHENVNRYNIKNILDILQKGQHNIIIGKQLAKKLNVHIGDKIKLILLSNKKNFFSGQIFNQGLFKIISIFSTQNEVDYYQILVNKEDSLNFLKYSKNYITGWRIWLKDPLFLDINEIKKLTNNLVLLDWKLQKGELFKAMKIENYIMFFLFFLILLVSVFNTFITFTAYIVEKKNAIAILKTQGLPNWKIVLIFVILVSSTAIIGNLLGIIISFLLIKSNFLKTFIALFFNEINLTIVILPFQIFFINIISILLTIFLTLYPAWNIIRLKPARIFYNE